MLNLLYNILLCFKCLLANKCYIYMCRLSLTSFIAEFEKESVRETFYIMIN